MCALGHVTEATLCEIVFCERFSLILAHLTLKVRVEGSLSEGKVARERVDGPKSK